MSEWTNIINASTTNDPLSGAINTPIQLSSTFNQKSFEDFGQYDYARSGNPTRAAGEKAIAQLEHGQYGYLFSTGMAAISSVLFTLSAGDHIIVSKHVYGGTFRVLEDILSRWGIRHDFVDFSDLDAIEATIRPETKALYIETPSNPVLNITDIRAVVNIAKKNQLFTIADNTFLSPFLQNPLDLGVDIVIHSATKFLAGHSDILAGAVVVNDKKLADKIYFIQNAVGATLGILDTWLLLRGIKTLGVRMSHASASAQKIAQHLNAHSKVLNVLYPGLQTHKGYRIHVTQAKNGGAVLSFDVGSKENAKKLVDALKIPVFSVSLGAVESIISYPPKMSHAELNTEELTASGITPGLLRFSVGLEDTDDLIADLDAALALI
ncbi:cystathionine gamma-synthase [Leuconostoc litchii]|uniref:cysteine-S-conjugate beta-lyase n=1 Tax=Leuconostoc litchii TaxID=1981069 RepID=A0A652NEA3_9LACO|nr:aminotransferase class I/II-fold pyridoxal phosphate-dependent enzyme [Leuconostoc litchii]TYC46526.1 aminotransferase class V-fold PLP-dependent enzyme [Leuconostoc litchii]GMA70155.1 cystathionine gamma-synthase [Leuconostoc litchii]